MLTFMFAFVWPVALLAGQAVYHHYRVKQALAKLEALYKPAVDEVEHVEEVAEGYVKVGYNMLKGGN